MIATSGLSGLGEIPQQLSKKDIQERFGSPISSGITTLGRETETYRIRRKLVEETPFSSPMFWAVCLIPFQFNPCLQMAVAEPFIFPFVLMRSENQKLEVAFVYGDDRRPLYHYETKSDPSWRYSQALSPMTHPLMNIEEANCPKLIVCVERYNEEARRRAEEVGYSLTNEDEEFFRKRLEIAGNLEKGEITKEEALRQYNSARQYKEPDKDELSSSDDRFRQFCGASEHMVQRKVSPDHHNAMLILTDRLLDGMKDSSDRIGDAVAAYIDEFRKLLGGSNHNPTCADEITFQLEIEIAKDADEGKVTREEAINKLRTITTRHLTNLYYGRS